MEYKHGSTISRIKDAISNANFSKKPLDETLDEIIEDVYWKGAREQK